MKIVLIGPKMSLRPMDSEYKRRLAPSLALMTIAALTPEPHEVEIYDENVRALPVTFPEADLVGISVNVDTAKRAYAIAYRYQLMGIPVVFGGIHASACPDEVLQFGDSVCIGEAEGVWSQILEDVQNQCLKERYYCPYPTQSGNIASPRRDLVLDSEYLYTNIVAASRGCPHRCAFCYNSCDYVHHRYRGRPAADVVAEIKQLGVRHVMFIDDNLIGDLYWVNALVEALLPLNITWHAAVSADIGKHPDLLDKMQTSGCRSLFIGFESVNSKSLRRVKKRQNHVAHYDATIAAIHVRGMMVNASMVFGFDDEGPEIFTDTLRWLVANKVETLTSHILTPYPGTRLYKELMREGRIIDFDTSHYNTAHVVFQPKRMSREELYQGYLEMYRQFYSMTNIIKRLPAGHSNWIPYLLFNFGYRKCGKFTSRFGRCGGMKVIGTVARRLSYGIG